MPMARSTVGMMSTEWISACRSVEVVPAPAKTIGICWARRWMPPWSPATEEQEIEALDRGLEALAGVRPTGYRAPMWDLSWRTPALLAERGFLFDSSLMDADTPYELAVGEGSLVEIPIQWALDEWEQYCFLPDISGSGLIETPAKAVELWRAEFRALRAAGRNRSGRSREPRRRRWPWAAAFWPALRSPRCSADATSAVPNLVGRMTFRVLVTTGGG